jgi:hypothetical protein
MAIAYADILPGSRAHAGMYASGTIAMQMRPALVVPAVSVVIRDGRTYVFTVNTKVTSTGAEAAKGTSKGNPGQGEAVYKVAQQLVTTGRHQGSDVEITAGLNDGAHVVMQGAGFLNEGDTVRVVGATSKQP